MPKLKKMRLHLVWLAAGAVILVFAFQNCAPGYGHHTRLQEEIQAAGGIPVKHGDGSHLENY